MGKFPFICTLKNIDIFFKKNERVKKMQRQGVKNHGGF